jgi:hypothetical protein
MKHHLTTIAALAMSLMGGVLVPIVKADEWDKKTNIEIDQAINVEGNVLPPGSYVMRLVGSSPDRHTVQIFNADGNHLIATILAIPEYRLVGTGDSEFKFYEHVEGQPPALRTWFYPGDNFGFGFRLHPTAGLASAARRTNATAPNAGSE